MQMLCDERVGSHRLHMCSSLPSASCQESDGDDVEQSSNISSADYNGDSCDIPPCDDDHLLCRCQIVYDFNATHLFFVNEIIGNFRFLPS